MSQQIAHTGSTAAFKGLIHVELWNTRCKIKNEYCREKLLYAKENRN